MAQTKRSITITDTSLTSSSNIDTYFSEILDDWNTKDYIILLHEKPTVFNELCGTFSGHSYQSYLIGSIWRANSALTGFNGTDRSNRNIVVVSGHTYDIYDVDIMN